MDISNSQMLPQPVEDLLAKKDKLIAEQQEKIETLSSKLSWFEQQFNLLRSKKFSKSSETQHALQLSLFDEDGQELQQELENPKQETITYTRKKPNRNNKPLDTSALPREINVIDLSDEEKQCTCGNCLEQFGEDRREELVFQPAQFKVIEHVRPKYTCRSCETVKMAKAVELPIPKSKASASLIAEVILNKYQYHLPFYRQSKMMANHQITIPDNTLAGWVMKASEQLAPLGEALWQAIHSVHVLQADETPVKLLKPEKKAYMWLYHCYLPGKQFVVFDFHLGRGSAAVDTRLEQFSGLLQTDGYAGYNNQRKRKDIISLGCWDHARRKFTDVVKACGNNKTGKAGKILKKIAELYDIESRIKTLTFDERKRIRQKEAKPKLAAIHSFLMKINAPPKSLLATAVNYCKNQWADLTQYIDYGEAQISNCWIENQVRPFAVGKRNWLFVGNEASAQKAALLYSLIQSCLLNKINPRQYLVYVLKQVHAIRRREVSPDSLLPHTINPQLIK